MISQSRLKAFEQAVCPRKYYGEYVSKELPGFKNEAMEKGSYFETMTIGGGAGYSADVTDLPRLKNGEKSADHERIDKQIAKFKRMFDPNDKEFIGFEILHTQKPLKVGNVEGTLDLVVRQISTGKVYLTDLKLTADIEKGYWSNTDDIDFVQAATYKWMWKELFGEDLDFLYLIFDYSPRTNVLLLEVQISDQKIEETKSRFEDSLIIMSEYDQLEEWPRIPSINGCRYCQLSCSKRINSLGYNFKSISI